MADDRVILPSEAAQATIVKGTPSHQQDLADDPETLDFAFEAFDAVTSAQAPRTVGESPSQQASQQQTAQPPAQQPAQQQPQVEVPELEFQLVPDVAGVAQQSAVEPPAPAQQPEQQPALAPTAQPSQQVPGGAVPQPGAVVTTPVGQQASLVDPFEFVANQIAAQEQQFVQALAEKSYPISDEDYQAFLGGDSKKMSVFAARVHANVLASVMKAMSINMPVVMNGLMSAHEANRRAEDAFYGTNKFLDRNSQQHKVAVAMAVKAVRGANPQADEATVAKMSGLMAAMSLGIDPAAVMQQRQQTPQVKTPGRVVRQVPSAYVPAAPGGAAGVNGTVPSGNEWDFTAQIINAEERGAFETR